MSLELYMVGLVVKDLEKSREFYTRLGLDVPPPLEKAPHVPIKMASEMTFFLDTRTIPRDDPEAAEELGNYKILFEFFLPSREAVDAKYADMIEWGARSYRAPYLSTFNMYFALIDDPDGNNILLSAE